MLFNVKIIIKSKWHIISEINITKIFLLNLQKQTQNN